MSQLVDLSQVDDEAITGVLSGTSDPDDPKVEKEPSTQSTDEAIKDEKELVSSNFFELLTWDQVHNAILSVLVG